MKYISFLLIFAIGFAVGRWSVRDKNSAVVDRPQEESSLLTNNSQIESTNETGKTVPLSEEKSQVQESKLPENPKLVRTDSKTQDKQIRNLFSQLMEANEKNQIDEQNRIFREMETLNPRHETVFQARAMFLQEDEDWQGAHDVLKECVSIIPESVYCLRRLANIRSSTIDEKLRYGTECLQASKNDPLCLVDLAMALQSKGDFAKAKEYFEQALNLPQGSEGFKKDYILYQYARTLQSLGLYPKAKAALTEACRLNMKSACEELQTLGR